MSQTSLVDTTPSLCQHFEAKILSEENGVLPLWRRPPASSQLLHEESPELSLRAAPQQGSPEAGRSCRKWWGQVRAGKAALRDGEAKKSSQKPLHRPQPLKILREIPHPPSNLWQMDQKSYLEAERVYSRQLEAMVVFTPQLWRNLNGKTHESSPKGAAQRVQPQHQQLLGHVMAAGQNEPLLQNGRRGAGKP